MQYFFWLCVFGAGYSYFLYPLLLLALAARHRVPEPTIERSRIVSVIIAARNEQGKIAQKIENTLGLDSLGVPLEIFVASDASDDATDEIVRSYADRGVRLVRSDERLGKESAQAKAIRASTGDILVFTDAGTILPEDAIKRLMVAFEDASVGAVSSVDRFIAEDGVLQGEGLYVRYEMWLRDMESRVAGLVGLSGSFFAARRRVSAQWDIHSPSDFNTALNCARAGLRAISAPDVFGFYRDLKDPRKEYQRKVRTVLRGITAIVRHPDVLNPFRFGLFAWQVWSHKVMRWLVPCFLTLLFLVTLPLAPQGWIYALALIAQLGFYIVALLAHFSPRLRALALPKLIYFFVQVNIGIADALCRFLAGKRMTTWQPSAR